MIIFEEMLSVAASKLYCLIRILHYQITRFMSKKQRFKENNKNNRLIC